MGSQKDLAWYLQMLGFFLSAVSSPWIASKISIANLGRLGAFIAVAIAGFFMLIIESSASDWIQVVQGISIIIGFDDGLLFTSVLSGILNLTTPQSRGNTGWILSLTILSYPVGSQGRPTVL